MPSVTAILRDEQVTIVRTLEATEDLAQRIEGGESVRAEDLAEMTGCLCRVAERGHLDREEAVLFPRLEQKGLSREEGPIGIMLAQHRQAHELLDLMESAALDYGRGSPAAAARWAQLARIYMAMLRFQIEIENKVLFLMADSMLSPAEQAELAAALSPPEPRKRAPASAAAEPFQWIG